MKTSQEQKDLCISLYKEGNHTIKEILEQTGLRYAPYVYSILDEAGIPRKCRRSVQKGTDKTTINISESRMKFMSSLCRLYHGEEHNPHSSEDHFKRYMWRNERKILENSQTPDMIEMYSLDNPKNWIPFFKSQVMAYISLWEQDNSRKWLATYLEYRKKGC